MSVDDQQATVDFLMDPSTHGGAVVERIDTHSAMVFLVGPRALKLKRAVRYDYLDFSTEPLRRAACEAEVRLNRRTAPSIYRGVVPVTREPDGSLALNGSGTPIDWLVDMLRFDQDRLFDRLAARDGLDLPLMRSLGTAIAEFHLAAERRDDHGGYAGMQWVINGNAVGFAEQGMGILDSARCAEVTRLSEQELERLRDVLDRRRHNGLVRRCHGDLHLRNIVLLEGRPTLFDAIEFNDEIACIDTLYDSAFLLMDLWRRRLPRHANAVFNSYIARTDDVPGLAVLPLFLSCRAAVRAKTSASAARLQTDPRRIPEQQDLARDYITMAMELLTPVPPCLVAIGGLSGSGKSTLAQALAPSIGRVPGSVVFRSDEMRKALSGVSALQRLGPEGYTSEVTEHVYRKLADGAAAALRAGHSVIVDAVFATPSQRSEIEAVASVVPVPFIGIWLEAPQEILVTRAERRVFDVSDADADVVRRQLAREVGAIAWHRLDASTSQEVVLERARAVIT